MSKNIKIALFASILILLVPIYIAVASIGLPYTYLPLVMKYVPPTLTPTSTGAPPPPTGNVVITTIFYDGSGPNEPDEYVEIRNDDPNPIQLANWTLRDQAHDPYIFPNFVIQVHQICRIYTNQNHPESCGFNYAYGSAIWNNTGDCAYLRDSGFTLIDEYCY